MTSTPRSSDALYAPTRRVAAGDGDALADMTGLAAELDDTITNAVTGLREAGYLWAEIAARLVSPGRQRNSAGAARRGVPTVQALAMVPVAPATGTIILEHDGGSTTVSRRA